MRLMSENRNYVITSAIARDMLGDHEFYLMCPIYLFMKSSAMEAYSEYKQRLIALKHDNNVMNPILNLFFNHTLLQYKHDPTNLGCIKKYIGKKVGVCPTNCELHVRNGNTDQKLFF